jgi:hypothetical protein
VRIEKVVEGNQFVFVAEHRNKQGRLMIAEGETFGEAYDSLAVLMWEQGCIMEAVA